MTNLTIATPTGAGNVNILNCEISGTLTKSSNADYTVLRLCDYGSASITGAGLVAIFGGNPNFTTVNNASANIIIKSAVTVAPVLTSGTLSLVDSIVVAAVTNAITSASSSIITLANCQMLTSALNNVAPVVLSGFYSILNCVYDKTNSTLVALSATGGSTNSIDYFQYINADKFITQGGTSSDYVKGDGSLGLLPNTIVYTTGNQAISGVKTFSDLPFVNGTGVSISGHTHAISDVTGLQSALDLKQPSGSYAVSSHTHTASHITDFNSSVSGLLPVKNITPSSYIDIVSSTGNFTISVTGLQPSGSYAAATHYHSISDVTGLQTSLDSKQPSGNYAASSHTHTASQITDFNSSVSGLLPVKDIVPGTNVTVTSSSGIYTINSTASGGGTQILSYASVANFPATGSTSSYYLASDSSRLYQWTGSYYAEIGPPISSVNNAQNAANLYMWSNFK
jgi:hypothetical protein